MRECISIFRATIIFCAFLISQNWIVKSSVLGSDNVYSRNNVPYQISIKQRNAHRCGGVIIDKSYVFTAAHCVIDGKDADVPEFYTIEVNLGNGETKVFNVKNIYIHPQYNQKTIENNIAILKVSFGTFPVNAKIVRIPFQDENVEDYQNCIQTRWNWQNKVRIIPKSLCSLTYTFNEELYKNIICAKNINGTLVECQDDFDGLLICNEMLTGIISQCELIDQPAVYIQIQKYQSWIESVVNPYKVLNGISSKFSYSIFLIFFFILAALILAALILAIILKKRDYNL